MANLLRPVDDSKGINAESTIVVLTGDGERERRILRAIAPRFNGESTTLLIPTLPLPLGREPRGHQLGRYSGLSALPTAKMYVSKYGIARSLFIVDREHLDQSQDTHSMIEDALGTCGIRDVHPEPLGEHAFLVECSVGFHRMIIHLVISGDHRCIEENIARLISLEYRIDVEPTKVSIDHALSQVRTSLSQLIVNAGRGNLNESFPGLTAALRRIEASARSV